MSLYFPEWLTAEEDLRMLFDKYMHPICKIVDHPLFGTAYALFLLEDEVGEWMDEHLSSDYVKLFVQRFKNTFQTFIGEHSLDLDGIIDSCREREESQEEEITSLDDFLFSLDSPLNVKIENELIRELSRIEEVEGISYKESFINHILYDSFEELPVLRFVVYPESIK